MTERLRHQDRHPDYVEDCRACHFRSVAVGFHGVPGGRAEWHDSPSVAAREKAAVAANTKAHGPDGFSRA